MKNNRERYYYSIMLIVLLFASVVLGAILMLGVYALPTQPVFSHIQETKSMFQEGYIDSWLPGEKSTTASYPTESFMLGHALYTDSKPVYYNAFMVPSYQIGNGDPVESISKVLEYENVKNIKSAASYVSAIDSYRYEGDDTSELKTMYYPRYWHGYLLFLKPLLLFMNVSEIKLLSMGLQMVLLVIACMLVYGRFGKGVSFAFMSTVLLLNPVTMAITMQEADIYYIVLLSVIFILWRDKKQQEIEYPLLFCLIGIVTCFVDYLTYPLVALCIPLCFVILIRAESSFKQTFLEILCSSAAWGFGYIGMWFGKLAICELFTDYHAIKEGLRSILFRISGDAVRGDALDIRYRTVLSRQWEVFKNIPFVLLVLALVMYCLIKYIRGYRNSCPNTVRIALLLIAAVPFVWYRITANHSVIHPHIVYRVATIVWFALCSILLFRFKKIDAGKVENGT